MLVPVLDKDGSVLLYDIFVAGQWVGSRRTIPQAIEVLRSQGWPSSVVASHHEISDGRIIFTDAEK